MNNLIKVALIAFLCLSFKAQAQLTPQHAQYLQFPVVINPATVGTEDYIDMTASSRWQWVGLEGAPNTQTFAFNTPVVLDRRSYAAGKHSHHGVGAFVSNDASGPFDIVEINLSYAYHLRVQKKFFVSIGTTLNRTQYKIGEGELYFVQTPDDPSIQTNANGDTNVSLGTYIYSSKLFLGIAANKIINNVSPYTLLETETSDRNYNVVLGSRFDLNRNVQFVPSVMVKSADMDVMQWDLNARFYLLQKLWGGVSYRNQDAILPFFGLQLIKGLWAGYSYEIPLAKGGLNQDGTHELLVGYRYHLGQKDVICPQFLW